MQQLQTQAARRKCAAVSPRLLNARAFFCLCSSLTPPKPAMAACVAGAIPCKAATLAACFLCRCLACLLMPCRVADPSPANAAVAAVAAAAAAVVVAEAAARLWSSLTPHAAAAAASAAAACLLALYAATAAALCADAAAVTDAGTLLSTGWLHR